jgi:DNA-directed RNA polymerase subunit RPC12/RpoP
MAFRCPKCGREYDSTLFEFGLSIRCECGQIIDSARGKIWKKMEKILSDEEERNIRTLQKMVDRVCSLIVASDYPPVDIELEIEKVREKCRELFPDKTELFEMIYASRFRRLFEQFRFKNFPEENF